MKPTLQQLIQARKILEDPKAPQDETRKALVLVYQSNIEDLKKAGFQMGEPPPESREIWSNL